MPSYGLDIFAIGDATTNVAGIIQQHYGGSQWEWNLASNPTLSINGGASAAHASVNDGINFVLQDDVTSQTLAAPVTIGPTTHAAGSRIENEYEIDLTDGVTVFRFVAVSINNQIIGFTFEGGQPPAGVTLSYVPSSAADYQSMVPCFARGTHIATPGGAVAVERLRPGMLVHTADAGAQPIRWIGRRRVPAITLSRRPHLRPIRFAPGALGPGCPSCRLRLSPQHRVLLDHAQGLLLPAATFRHLPGVQVASGRHPVLYVHFALDAHHLVLADGVWVETLFPGPQALRAFRRNGSGLTGGMTQGMTPARPFLSGAKARQALIRASASGQAIQTRGLDSDAPCIRTQQERP